MTIPIYINDLSRLRIVAGITLILLHFFFFSFPSVCHAQENTEEQTGEGAGDVNAVDEIPAEDLSENGQTSGRATAGDAYYSVGFTFQYWSPFTEVTSSLIGELAGAGEFTGIVSKPSGDNATDNLDEVSTEAVSIVTIKLGGQEYLDNLHVDLTEGFDPERLNPFDSRVDESSKKENLKKSLTEEKAQASRLASQFKLLNLPDLLDLVFRFSEENFVSQVKPSKDTLFISFSGAEALIPKGLKIQLETSFEDKMTGISNFNIPGTEIPIGFLGYFELRFQKPILLPLTPSASITKNNITSTVDAVIIFPQFSAVGMMVEWFKSSEEGFDISGYLKFGHGNINIGQGNEHVNELISAEDSTGLDTLFVRSASIFFSGGLLRLSYLGETLEFSATGEWRVFVLEEEFNGIKSQKPLSVDLITSLELLYRL
ncbi:MAG: hypothetical protein HQM14_17240 [SAR324 cluster bacterium]|nr:hypothetical protein [SAR324 cluster bacterium]